ncbi:diacylglycerol kinase family lipid kinase [Geomonas sp. Red32]|nr:diacylglycerol kinase family lipid kinase [Geomonas sp. Red32]
MNGLKQGGMEAELLPTTSALDPALFAKRLCDEVADPLIVVAGGDGTVNGVLNGLTAKAATLAVVPMGTSNVLARELKIATAEDAVARIVRGDTRPVSVGEISCGGETKRFLLMAGVGVDGAVVEGVRLAEKRRFGKGAYALSAFRVMRDWDRASLTVTGGGRSVECHSVIVCNAVRYAGDFLLAPQADLFAPGFQVVCIKGGRTDYFKLFLLLLAGRVSEGSGVTVFSAEEVEITGNKAVQCDGDYFGCAPLRMRSLGEFMRVVV